MNDFFQIILFLLALVNLVAIAVSIFFKKDSWSIALSILEIVLVYLAAMV